MNVLYWAMTLYFKAYFHLFYRLKILGTKHYRKGCAIIAPNHTSYYDPPLIGLAWPEEIHFLARHTLFAKPFRRWFFTNLNTHPVEGLSNNLDTFKIVCKLLAEGKKVVIFPEGQRSTTGELLPIKSGIAMLALRMKCPIIPAYVDGAYEAWPRSSRFPHLGGQITCIFGEPILVDAYLGMDKKRAQEALAKCVEDGLAKLRAQCELERDQHESKH